MSTLSRRQFLQLAAALGATLASGCATVRPSTSGWRERRDLFPQGVASGDPDAHSVLLWTRRPFDDGRERATLLVESGGPYAELKSVILYCDVEILGDPDDVAANMAKVRADGEMSSSMSASMSEQVRASMAKRVILRLTPFRTISWDHTKLAGFY